MAIIAYTGLPGHGKSYGIVANVIVPALTPTKDNPLGREVWTNIPLNMEAVKERFPTANVTIFDVQDMIDDPGWCINTVPPGVVFVLDEVWRVWPAGQSPASTPVEYKTFLAEHRHRVSESGMATEIVLCSQDLAQLSNFSRQLIEETYITRKLTNLGSTKKFRVDVYSGAIKGDSRPKTRHLNTLYGQFSPKTYALYKSHTMSKSGSAGSELKPDKRGSLFANPAIKFGVPILAVLLVAGVYFSVQVFTGGVLSPKAEDHKESSGTGGSAPSSVVQTGAPAHQKNAVYTGPVYSKTWRLSGVVEGGDYMRVMLVNLDGATRVVSSANCGRYADTGELYCHLNGERITQWTAPTAGISRETKTLLPVAQAAS
tara:strand:- start:1889 stop:3004 length:1116 start_codon:yes stop_codon:yes gene_type:complete